MLAAGSHACRKASDVRYDMQVVRFEQGWGYKISKNNKPFITQDCIPAVAGKKTFANRRSARKTGKLVLSKLRSNRIPAVNTEELEELGVLGEQQDICR